MEFVLASQSPARLMVLRAAGIQPVVQVSGVDEDAIAAALPENAPHEHVVVTLAEAKAREVAPGHADAVIVGCDSMLSHGGELVGKPGTAERARERWKRMAGGEGRLMTGHAVLRVRDGVVEAVATGTVATTIRFGSPTEDEVEAYVGTGEPLSVAGGFTLDGFGGWFVDGVDGDPSSVIGISLPLTRKLLAEIGVRVVDLWATGSP
ncbi:Maf family protein [Actinophytocola algeriensis]|uniref:Nucleoside triphosphate pyrophosphatase n=1 Tax=Actinophytocola algeriensis TaxID=1768010 RepID=A0A7W7PYW0_9PSEU|nr:Maf family protein [Actinophytocola algeriensis]MBB4903875.1 septum formation protein [Actinophytocola algeriensis]MBE1477268.1 septum formation protein [Actinophytocola algeriensis]